MRALFRGTVKHKATGRGKNREEKLPPFPQMCEHQLLPTWITTSSLSSQHPVGAAASTATHSLTPWAAQLASPEQLKHFIGLLMCKALNCSTKPASSHRCFQQSMGTGLVSEAGVEESGSLQFISVSVSLSSLSYKIQPLHVTVQLPVKEILASQNWEAVRRPNSN